MADVGLGYLRLCQPLNRRCLAANAQRLKLATQHG
jgi:excinuclease UvrABC ATPase subunit